MKSKNLLMSMTVIFFFFTGMALNSVKAATASSNHSGTICKNYYRKDVTYVDYLYKGTRSYKNSNTYVICPLVRRALYNPSGSSAVVHVDFKHNQKGTTKCTLYSHDYNGSFLGSHSLSWTGRGFHTLSLYLDKGKVRYSGNLSVLCSIPGKYKGILMGLDLTEYY